jgi:hypothetical protein
MNLRSDWDWESGKRSVLDLSSCAGEYEWIEEPSVSPDGEGIAFVARLKEEGFGVHVNNGRWEPSFDKAWNLRFHRTDD